MAKTALIALVVLLGCSAPEGRPAAAPVPGLRTAIFESDVTPPLGHPLCGGWVKPVGEIVQPLVLKGIVIENERTRYLIASIEWCVLAGTAHDLFTNRMAIAAGIPPSQVALQATHTHSAPIADARAEQMIAGTPQPPRHLDLEWLAKAASDAARAVDVAIHHLQPFTHVGVGQARVEQFAATRRVPGPDGKIRVRYSLTKEPSLRDAPEGTIDPWLKTVTLYDGETPLVRLHYYASHPQTHQDDGQVDPDTAGIARAALEREEGVAQIYFTGCAGDITAGKYNDGSLEARKALADQLHLAMGRAIEATRRIPVAELSWKTVDLRLASRSEPEFSETELRKRMSDPGASAARRLQAALGLAWAERVRMRPAIELSRLRLGPADLLHLPGEPFIAFQLHAQSFRPDRFVAVAGYGDGGPGYICTDQAISEGGYEPTASFVGPPSEALLKSAIEELLR